MEENVKDTEEVKNVEETENNENTEIVDSNTEEVPETTEEEEPKPKPGEDEYTKSVKKRIDKITREKYEALKRANELENRLKEFEATAGGRPSRPNIASFTNDMGELDHTSYDSAMAKYEDSLFDWRERKNKNSNTEYDQKAEAESKVEKFNILADNARIKYPDFDEVVSRPVFGQELREAVVDSDVGDELAYYLGNNKAVAAELNNMPPYRMMKEVGKLEEKISRLNKKVSKALDPITPVSGTSGTVTKTSEQMSDSEWIEAERKRRMEKIKNLKR
jgi:hypothetical protein